MNKKKIEKMLPIALKTLADKKCGVSENGKISKSYRSAISSFGAAVTMGSFRAAVAFFSKDADKGDAGISRSKLLRAIDYLCQTWDSRWIDRDKNAADWRTAEKVCAFVLERPQNEIKLLEQDFLHAAVALKLAMNAFDLGSDQKDDNEPKEGARDEKPESPVQ